MHPNVLDIAVGCCTTDRFDATVAWEAHPTRYER
jgi:hypothetical protein